MDQILSAGLNMFAWRFTSAEDVCIQRLIKLVQQHLHFLSKRGAYAWLQNWGTSRRKTTENIPPITTGEGHSEELCVCWQKITCAQIWQRLTISTQALDPVNMSLMLRRFPKWQRLWFLSSRFKLVSTDLFPWARYLVAIAGQIALKLTKRWVVSRMLMIVR